MVAAIQESFPSRRFRDVPRFSTSATSRPESLWESAARTVPTESLSARVWSTLSAAGRPRSGFGLYRSRGSIDLGALGWIHGIVFATVLSAGIPGDHLWDCRNHGHQQESAKRRDGALHRGDRARGDKHAGIHHCYRRDTRKCSVTNPYSLAKALRKSAKLLGTAICGSSFPSNSREMKPR